MKKMCGERRSDELLQATVEKDFLCIGLPCSSSHERNVFEMMWRWLRRGATCVQMSMLRFGMVVIWIIYRLQK